MPQTILVVDDHPTQRRLLEGVLEKLGYRVLVASSGPEAIEFVEKISSQSFDLMLLDLETREGWGTTVRVWLTAGRLGAA